MESTEYFVCASMRMNIQMNIMKGKGAAPGASAAMATASPAPEEVGHVLEQRDGARAVVPELERLHARAHKYSYSYTDTINYIDSGQTHVHGIRQHTGTDSNTNN